MISSKQMTLDRRLMLFQVVLCYKTSHKMMVQYGNFVLFKDGIPVRFYFIANAAVNGSDL